MSFQDIKGQDRAVDFFKRALKSKQVSSAYLFSGPSGVGKTLLAHTLSKALNCADRDDDACDTCVSCLKVEAKGHPDVIWIDAADDKEEIGIEQIRELQRRINLRPYEGKQKVFIIQNADAMTQDAANCLLKTLEEPPADSVIILIASNPELLLPTVRSRCKQIKLDPLSPAVRAELALKMGFSKEEALFLSKLSSSGIGEWPDIKEGAVFDYRNRVLEEFNSGATLLDEKSFLFNESRDMMKFALSILESWFRDIMVLKSGADRSIIMNSDRAQDLEGVKDRLGFEALESALRETEDAFFCVTRNVGPKVTLNRLKMKISELTK